MHNIQEPKQRLGKNVQALKGIKLHLLRSQVRQASRTYDCKKRQKHMG